MSGEQPRSQEFDLRRQNGVSDGKLEVCRDDNGVSYLKITTKNPELVRILPSQKVNSMVAQVTRRLRQYRRALWGHCQLNKGILSETSQRKLDIVNHLLEKIDHTDFRKREREAKTYRAQEALRDELLAALYTAREANRHVSNHITVDGGRLSSSLYDASIDVKEFVFRRPRSAKAWLLEELTRRFGSDQSLLQDFRDADNNKEALLETLKKEYLQDSLKKALTKLETKSHDDSVDDDHKWDDYPKWLEEELTRFDESVVSAQDQLDYSLSLVEGQKLVWDSREQLGTVFPRRLDDSLLAITKYYSDQLGENDQKALLNYEPALLGKYSTPKPFQYAGRWQRFVDYFTPKRKLKIHSEDLETDQAKATGTDAEDTEFKTETDRPSDVSDGWHDNSSDDSSSSDSEKVAARQFNLKEVYYSLRHPERSWSAWVHSLYLIPKYFRRVVRNLTRWFRYTLRTIISELKGDDNVPDSRLFKLIAPTPEGGSTDKQEFTKLWNQALFTLISQVATQGTPKTSAREMVHEIINKTFFEGMKADDVSYVAQEDIEKTPTFIVWQNFTKFLLKQKLESDRRGSSLPMSPSRRVRKFGENEVKNSTEALRVRPDHTTSGKPTFRNPITKGFSIVRWFGNLFRHVSEKQPIIGSIALVFYAYGVMAVLAPVHATHIFHGAGVPFLKHVVDPLRELGDYLAEGQMGRAIASGFTVWKGTMLSANLDNALIGLAEGLTEQPGSYMALLGGSIFLGYVVCQLVPPFAEELGEATPAKVYGWSLLGVKTGGAFYDSFMHFGDDFISAILIWVLAIPVLLFTVLFMPFIKQFRQKGFVKGLKPAVIEVGRGIKRVASQVVGTLLFLLFTVVDLLFDEVPGFIHIFFRGATKVIHLILGTVARLSDLHSPLLAFGLNTQRFAPLRLIALGLGVGLFIVNVALKLAFLVLDLATIGCARYLAPLTETNAREEGGPTSQKSFNSQSEQIQSDYYRNLGHMEVKTLHLTFLLVVARYFIKLVDLIDNKIAAPINRFALSTTRRLRVMVADTFFGYTSDFHEPISYEEFKYFKASKAKAETQQVENDGSVTPGQQDAPNGADTPQSGLQTPSR